MKLLLAAMSFLVLLLHGTGVLGDYKDVDYEEFQSKLYLYKTEQEQVYKGSHKSLLEAGVTGAGMTGAGCFLILEKENSHKVEGTVSLEFPKEITVRSIRFLQEGCAIANVANYHNKGTVIVVAVCLAVLFVALLGIALLCVRRQRRGVSEERQPENV